MKAIMLYMTIQKVCISNYPPKPLEFETSNGTINTYAHLRLKPITTRNFNKMCEPNPLSSG